MTTAAELAAIGLKRRAWRTRLSRCFELAYLTLMDAPADSDWRLVHGTAKFDNERIISDCLRRENRTYDSETRIAHAWLRRGSLVYDPALDLLLDSDAYEATLGAVEAAVYTRREAAELAAAHRNKGAWVELDGLSELYQQRAQR